MNLNFKQLEKYVFKLNYYKPSGQNYYVVVWNENFKKKYYTYTIKDVHALNSCAFTCSLEC